MSKPLIGGSKATLPSAIIKPGKYKPAEKFRMEMPDETKSGMYGIKPTFEDELVESLALDESIH